jgi:hypothetical protein
VRSCRRVRFLTPPSTPRCERHGGPSHHTMVATTTAAALAATTIHSTAAARVSTTAPTIPALTDEGPAGAQVESRWAAPHHRLSSPAPRSTAGELYCFAGDGPADASSGGPFWCTGCKPSQRHCGACRGPALTAAPCPRRLRFDQERGNAGETAPPKATHDSQRHQHRNALQHKRINHRQRRKQRVERLQTA